MSLSNEQISFLERHNISLGQVLNAEGMIPKEYQEILNSSDYIVAVNSNSKKVCGKGHKLQFRDRHGKCVECRVSSFSFVKASIVGYVYVVGSLKGSIIKVGCTDEIKKRIEKLNENIYGGLNDWELLYKGKYSNAREVEAYIQRELKEYYKSIEYDKWGKGVMCYETFQCSFSEARNIIDSINDNLYFVTEEYYLPLAGSKYNFDNIISNNKRYKIKLK